MYLLIFPGGNPTTLLLIFFITVKIEHLIISRLSEK